jgi:outer membrane murein-binding lipoprotein Lpp
MVLNPFQPPGEPPLGAKIDSLALRVEQLRIDVNELSKSLEALHLKINAVRSHFTPTP